MSPTAYTQSRRREFAKVFRAALEEKNLGVRTLAGQLANGDARLRETERRALNKYLAGKAVPETGRRERIEDELGLERDSLKVDEDEESDSLLADLYTVVFARRRKAQPA